MTVSCYPVHISLAPCVTRCSHLCEIRFVSKEKLQKIAIQKLTKIQSSTCKFYKGSGKIFIYKIRYHCCSMCRYFSSFSMDPSCSLYSYNHQFSTSYLYWLKKYGDKYGVRERERGDKNKNISTSATWLMTLVSLRCGQCLIYSPGNRDPQYNDKTG